MADQKTEDTKSPLPRRGARPFAGPAGTSAARPFLRPVTTPQRATAAPFVPPVVPGKPALGTTPTLAPKAPTPVVTHAVPAANPDAVASSRPRPVTSEMIAVDTFDAFETVWGPDNHPVGTTEPQAEPHAGPEAEPEAATSPLDESSLGSGIDAQAMWADDITAAGDVAAGKIEPPAAPFVPPVAESTYTTPTSAIPAWLEDDAPAEARPAEAPAQTPETVSELQAPAATPAWPAGEYDASYEITEWTPAHGVPTADDPQPLPAQSPAAAIDLSLGTPVEAADSGVDTPTTAPAEFPRFELVPEPEAEPHAVEAVDSELAETTGALGISQGIHHRRIAAALDRLADRIRSGEIDVSSIAPDAPDAAVLASVLAALLGGSSSR
jgi:hypothetical protein